MNRNLMTNSGRTARPNFSRPKNCKPTDYTLIRSRKFFVKRSQLVQLIWIHNSHTFSDKLLLCGVQRRCRSDRECFACGPSPSSPGAEGERETVYHIQVPYSSSIVEQYSVVDFHWFQRKGWADFFLVLELNIYRYLIVPFF